jgi:hypothetical protein
LTRGRCACKDRPQHDAREGWAVLAADIIVMANLADIAGL